MCTEYQNIDKLAEAKIAIHFLHLFGLKSVYNIKCGDIMDYTQHNIGSSTVGNVRLPAMNMDIISLDY